HSGTFGIADGATLSFTGGTNTLQTGTVFDGNTTGAVTHTGGTLSIAGNVTDGALFTQSGGTLTLTSGTLTQNKNFTWSGATIDGTGTFTLGGGASFSLGGTGARILGTAANGGPTLNLG